MVTKKILKELIKQTIKEQPTDSVVNHFGHFLSYTYNPYKQDDDGKRDNRLVIHNNPENSLFLRALSIELKITETEVISRMLTVFRQLN